MNIIDRLRNQVDRHPYPLLFATISGAHLYGFPSADSDFDLRGVHLLPLETVVGLCPGEETIEKSGFDDGLEIDLVTHDAKKFFSLMLKNNGYVLEQLWSPLIVHTTAEHERLKQLAEGCLTRNHAHHYLGFAQSQWKRFLKESPPKVKPLLYLYRVLLTGIHLMRSGTVEANLLHLNEIFQLRFLDDLIRRKVNGAEHERLEEVDVDFHHQQYQRLQAELEQACRTSHLPAVARGQQALSDLLVQIRLRGNA